MYNLIFRLVRYANRFSRVKTPNEKFRVLFKAGIRLYLHISLSHAAVIRPFEQRDAEVR